MPDLLLSRLYDRRTQAGCAAVCGLAGLIIRYYRNQPKTVLWAPGSWPFLGNTVDILRALVSSRLLDLYHTWFQSLGLTFAYSVAGTNFVATVDPKVVEHVLKTNFDSYIKGSMFQDPFTDLLGEGIFNVDGELWHHQRKTASRLFSKKQFETHIWETVQANITKVVGILDAGCGKTIDMFGLMNRFTLDTIGQIGFSKSVGSLEDASSPFLRSFDQAQRFLILRFWINPAWRIMRFFRLGWEPELKDHLKLLHEYSLTIVRELKAKSAEAEDNSLVGLFLKDISDKEKEDPKTEDYLCDLVLNFLLAGRDTTAQCLAWTIFELTLHPDAVKKARAEIEEVFSVGPFTCASLKNLRYVKAIIDEGLRLHPSVPYDGKLCVQDDVLPNGTKVRAGSIVQYVPYAQSRCTEIWGADAEQFRPERWLEMKSRPSDFAYSVFNAGPRVCLGRTLAELEMTAFMATVLRSFDFELQVEPHKVHYDVQLTLGMNALPVKVTRVSAKPSGN